MKDITAITVNYNTPHLLANMLSSFRKFYDIEVIIVDGSDSNYKKMIQKVVSPYKNIRPYLLDYNIHHGKGLCYALERVETDKVLFIDSDVYFHRGGFLEDLDGKLRKTSYGIGDIQIIDDAGFNKPIGIKYLHPALCLLNMDMVMKFEWPINHGAPMIRTMQDIHKQGLSDEILQHESWVTNDFRNKRKVYLTHDWQGTVKKFGYNL
jgi:GT2 family glycosyltransferase